MFPARNQRPKSTESTSEAPAHTPEDIEVHGWWLEDEGKVAAFRHFVDTPKHIDAFTA